jgi:hypothetical protein
MCVQLCLLHIESLKKLPQLKGIKEFKYLLEFEQ